METRNSKITEVKSGLPITAMPKDKKDRLIYKGRIGFKRYEKSLFLFGSDISDKGCYSRS